MEKNKTTIFVILACILLIGITVSFAYYLASIQGEGKSITLKSKNLKITFTESNNLSGENISLGWSKTSTFTVKNESDSTYKYNISIKDLVNTFVTTGYLQYKITSADGGYNMSEFKDIPKSSTPKNEVLAYSIEIAKGETQTYSVEFRYQNTTEDQSADMGKELSGALYIEEGTEKTFDGGTLAEAINFYNPTIKTRTNFNIVFTETNTGTLYKAAESIANSPAKDVYYFAGNATNNWVKFANYYWRIIRTNHDGSIRLLYAGQSPDTTFGYLGTEVFNDTINNTINDSMYVGYMYGTSGSLNNNRKNATRSKIKTFIDNWYSNNLNSYSRYISTEAVYCNDREVGSGVYSAKGSAFNFAAYTRLSAGNPTYNCTNIKDVFSGSNIEAKLIYPIGLMTADELAYAGGNYNTKLTSPYAWYYLNSAGGSITGSTQWWTLSPAGWDSRYSNVWYVDGSNNPGKLYYGNVGNSKGVRPVISLKGNLVWKSGDGSSANPYEVEDLPPTLAETIKTHATSHTNGVYNENGYRYEGTDPNNYIYMTNKSTNEKELWRIIGVFNDGANGEEVIRVRRHYEKYNYTTMQYDSNSTNHFPNTTMYSTLSSTYNLTNYNHTVNFKMFLGTSSSPNSLTSSGWYTAERGNVPGVTAANSYNSSTSFIGSVGLIYPSDYGYGVLASDCARTTIASKYNATVACHNNNWLFHGGSNGQWLISPSASDAWGAFYIGSSAGLYSTAGVSNAMGYSPVMALSNDVPVSGSGTKTDPYTITN